MLSRKRERTKRGQTKIRAPVRGIGALIDRLGAGCRLRLIEHTTVAGSLYSDISERGAISMPTSRFPASRSFSSRTPGQIHLCRKPQIEPCSVSGRTIFAGDPALPGGLFSGTDAARHRTTKLSKARISTCVLRKVRGQSGGCAERQGAVGSNAGLGLAALLHRFSQMAFSRGGDRPPPIGEAVAAKLSACGGRRVWRTCGWVDRNPAR